MFCPECEGSIPIPSDVVTGEIVSCPDCGLNYEVQISLKSSELIGEDFGE